MSGLGQMSLPTLTSHRLLSSTVCKSGFYHALLLFPSTQVFFPVREAHLDWRSWPRWWHPLTWEDNCQDVFWNALGWCTRSPLRVVKGRCSLLTCSLGTDLDTHHALARTSEVTPRISESKGAQGTATSSFHWWRRLWPIPASEIVWSLTCGKTRNWLCWYSVNTWFFSCNFIWLLY